MWETFVGLDWPALTIAEEHGGIGLGFAELAVVAEELGRVLALGPLLATMAGFVPLLREADGGGSWLDEGRGRRDLRAPARSTPNHGPVRRRGRPDRGGASTVDVVWSPRADANAAHASGHSMRPGRWHARRPIRRSATAERLPITRGGRRSERGEEMTRRDRVRARRHVSDDLRHQRSQYAKERQQFGVPIGSFQAVKHKLANMFVAIERARALCVFAAATIDEDDDRRATAASAGEGRRR